ncbi:hypothetical protein AMTR_s00060p00156120 [Amborella trichopoda]|uniref:C3H1-type domain-containing protein n=1 Tax=Amborella trichopoda TaxID=13333 RepID=W1NJD7_AMBTC|nr:hypothetical protein AMTR_s00060p00156120 [Amborella trichopoda]
MERLINYSRALAPSDAPNRTLPRRSLSVFLGPAFDAEALRSYSCSPDLFPGNDVHRQISPDIGVRKQRFSLSPVTPPSPVLPPPSYGKGKEMEEGVLVMDGLLVNTFTKQQHKSSLMESTSSSSSNGSGDWAMGTLYKTDICRAWDDRGACRYGSKCQFAHGKEELRPVMRFPKNKGEREVEAL